VPAEWVLNITDAGDLTGEDDSSLSELVSDMDVDNLEELTGDDETQSAPESGAEESGECNLAVDEERAARDTTTATSSAAESVAGDHESQSGADIDSDDDSPCDDADIDDPADLDYSQGQRKRKRDLDEGGREKRRCGCASGVPDAFIALCTTGRAVNPAGQISLITGWFQHHRAGRHVCYQHAKNIASVLGMQTRNLNTEMLRRVQPTHNQR
jgi:hypothetical protein